MVFPWQITIGSLAIPLHAVLEAAGIFAGFRYFLYLRSKHPDYISSNNRTWILIGAIFGSLLGSRLIGGLENPEVLLNSNNKLIHFYENKTILGGLLGGLAGVELIKKFIGERRSSGDLFTYPLMLAMIIGRIGCFGMGVYEETYGTQTVFFTGMNLGDGKLRHPVALYEIVFLFILWGVLKRTDKNFLLAEGSMFKLFMICYLFFRFMLDFIKPHYTFSIGLSTIQLTCIAGLLYYFRFVLKPKNLLAANA